jgi:hypothetical protein
MDKDFWRAGGLEDPGFRIDLLKDSSEVVAIICPGYTALGALYIGRETFALARGPKGNYVRIGRDGAHPLNEWQTREIEKRCKRFKLPPSSS